MHSLIPQWPVLDHVTDQFNRFLLHSLRLECQSGTLWTFDDCLYISSDSHLSNEISQSLSGKSRVFFFFSFSCVSTGSSSFQQDGTLIGTSFLVCFGYWIGSSFAISSVSFICNTHLSLMQILSLNVKTSKDQHVSSS